MQHGSVGKQKPRQMTRVMTLVQPMTKSPSALAATEGAEGRPSVDGGPVPREVSLKLTPSGETLEAD